MIPKPEDSSVHCYWTSDESGNKCSCTVRSPDLVDNIYLWPVLYRPPVIARPWRRSSSRRLRGLHQHWMHPQQPTSPLPFSSTPQKPEVAKAHHFGKAPGRPVLALLCVRCPFSSLPGPSDGGLQWPPCSCPCGHATLDLLLLLRVLPLLRVLLLLRGPGRHQTSRPRPLHSAGEHLQQRKRPCCRRGRAPSSDLRPPESGSVPPRGSLPALTPPA